MLAAATSLSAFIVAGAVIGWLIDQRLASAPVGISAGVIFGTFAGVAQLVIAIGRADNG